MPNPVATDFRCAAIVLAGGMSRRMGSDKLLLPIGAKPMVLHPVDAALAAGLSPVIVVCGPDSTSMAALLGDRDVTLVANPHQATGMASSLALGIASLPASADGAIVLLGDMPLVGAPLIDTLVSFAARHPDTTAAVPSRGGRRGNPVVLRRALFAAVLQITGDTGARHLLQGDAVAELVVDDPAIFVDVDTHDDLVVAVKLIG